MTSLRSIAVEREPGRSAAGATVQTGGHAFRRLTDADLPMVGIWLDRPHVAEWWDGVADKLAEIREAMVAPSTQPFIVELDGRPVGYVQCYDPHLEKDHPYRDQPKGTLGIDLFIGPAELVGLGHGSRLIAAFAERLFREGARRVVSDPDPRNGRAIRAYAKAGFKPFDTRTSIYGDALMMARAAPAKAKTE
jgi:aminoglycoside 6'-N-acetyltransferase